MLLYCHSSLARHHLRLNTLSDQVRPESHKLKFLSRKNNWDASEPARQTVWLVHKRPPPSKKISYRYANRRTRKAIYVLINTHANYYKYVVFFGWFSGVWILCADVSEHPVCSNFIVSVNKKNNWDEIARVFACINILTISSNFILLEGRTDQRNAQIIFSLINLLLFKLLRHVSATQLEASSGSLKSLQVTSHFNLEHVISLV